MNKRKFISIILFLATVMFSFTGAFAQVKEEKIEPKAEYVIEAVDSEPIMENVTVLDAISETAKVKQVIFKVDIDDEEWSIGYFSPENEYSTSQMIENIQHEIDYLNSQESREATDFIELQDLTLHRVNLISDEQLGDIEFERMKTIGEVKAISANNDGVKLSSNISIDGSYHFKSGLSTKWYNQLVGTTTTCGTSLTSPHAGDGNSRFAAGYNWHPNFIKVAFKTDVDTNLNRTTLQYKYNAANLNNLAIDDNETLEMEVLFYNYHLNSGVSEANLGSAYMQTALTWSSNQPDAYLDTTFGDDSVTRAFCVGTSEANSLVSGTWYQWNITGAKGTRPGWANDGRFRVSAQRGYKTYGSGTFSVFTEEHEPTLILGINSSYNWVPSTQNAWILAEKNTTWSYDSSRDPLRT